MNPDKWEEKGPAGGTKIGTMLWKPRDHEELSGIIELSAIGFDPHTVRGHKAMLRCLRKHFLVKEK